MKEIRNRFRGCLLGGAIGDALGYPVEFMSLKNIRVKYGKRGVRKLQLHRGKALISDDTQMTLFTANGLLWAADRMKNRGIGDWISSGIYPAYMRWLYTQNCDFGGPYLEVQPFEKSENYHIMVQGELYASRAPGGTCLSALSSGIYGDAVYRINDSKGCGAVMRVAPIGLFFYNDVDTAFSVGLRSAAITHGHDTALIAAGTTAEIIAHIIQGDDILVAVQKAMDHIKNRKAGEETYTALYNAVHFALEGYTPDCAIPALGGGWVAEEALAIAVYCALYADNPRDAIIMSVNHSGDSDSTGAVCGNIVGAYYGEYGLDRGWTRRVELNRFITDTADKLLKATQERA